MSRRKLVAAIAAALLLVGLVIVTELVLPGWQARHAERDNLLLAATETLDTFAMERQGARLEFTKEPGGAWLITGDGAPPGLRGDTRAILAVIEALRGTWITSTIGRADELPLATHGLAPPRATLTWTRPDGPSWSLGLGTPSFAGQVNALAGDRVVLVPSRVLEVSDWGLDHFRVKRVLHVDEASIVRIEMERRTDVVPEGSSTRLVLTRRLLEAAIDDDPAWEWILGDPHDVPAQPVRVASLLSRLSALSALGFGPEVPDQQDLLASGLAQPAAILTLVTLDGGETRLAIGDPSPSKHAWARAGGGPIVEIREDIARDAMLPDDFWRDNRIVRLPRWRIQNVRMRKDTVFDLEIARDDARKWWVVRPEHAALDALKAEQLLGAMDDLLCGRFEDELAADLAALEREWDFDGPGSFDLSVLALLADGTPRRADVEMTPFLRQRLVYFAARITDEMGRVSACVTTERKVDDFLEQAYAIGLPQAAGDSR